MYGESIEKLKLYSISVIGHEECVDDGRGFGLQGEDNP